MSLDNGLNEAIIVCAVAGPHRLSVQWPGRICAVAWPHLCSGRAALIPII